MKTIADYLKPLTTRNIDKTKVLLIINSNSDFDSAIADYYQNKRNLSNNRLTFTQSQLTEPNRNTYISTVLLPIANYIISHGIECVIACPGVPETCPSSLMNFPYDMSSPTSSEAAFGNAVSYRNSSYVSVPGNDIFICSTEGNGLYNHTDDSYAGNSIKTPNGLGYEILFNLKDTDYKSHVYQYGRIPYGRLGIPYRTNQRIIDAGLALAQTYNEVKRIIDDCVYAEQLRRIDKIYILAFGDYVKQGKHLHQWYSWQFAKAAGLTCKYWIADANLFPLTAWNHVLTDLSIRNNPASWLGQVQDFSGSEVYNGLTQLTADYYSGSAIVNDGIMGVDYANQGETWEEANAYLWASYYKSLTPKRGAWGFNWCSSGRDFVENLIRKGGAAGIAPRTEPTTNGLPDDGSVMVAALRGYSLAEIVYLTCPPYSMTAYGDPLYIPMKPPSLEDTGGNQQTIITENKGRQVNNNTTLRQVILQNTKKEVICQN